MVKMRSPQGLFNWLHEVDPDCPITIGAIRRMLRAQVLPAVKVGRKYYIDSERFSEYMYNLAQDNTQTIEDLRPGIRKISE